MISGARKAGLTALRAYLLIAMILVIIKIIQVALGTESAGTVRAGSHGPGSPPSCR